MHWLHWVEHAKSWFGFGPADPRQQQERVVRSIERRCRGRLEPTARAAVNSALASGMTDLALQLDATGRTPCGYDVNDLILSAPLDGQPHEAPCPQCGTTIRWIAPRFE
jgi:hypothetical protein